MRKRSLPLATHAGELTKRALNKNEANTINKN